MKRHIIVFPGDSNGVFFKNELSSIVSSFDQIDIISFTSPDDSLVTCESSQLSLHSIKKTDLIKTIISVEFIKWFFEEPTREELKSVLASKNKTIKRLLYMVLYGVYGLTSKRLVDRWVMINKENYTVVYSFWLSRGAYAASLIKNHCTEIDKAVSRAHGYDLYEERNSSYYLPFRSFIYRKLDTVYFISEQGKEYYKSRYGFANNEKLQISRLGTYNPLKLRKTIDKKEKKEIVIASCSSVTDIKRVDLIVEVLSGISLPIRWFHIGDGPLLGVIESLAEKRLNRCQFALLGKIDNKAILERYIAMDVDFFINMSDSEGIPVSIMEAISVGIPAIARDVGGLKEIVNSETGLLLEEPFCIQKATVEVERFLRTRLNSTSQYSQMSNKCIELWEREYNAEKNYPLFFESL